MSIEDKLYQLKKRNAIRGTKLHIAFRNLKIKKELAQSTKQH